ncbi:hypothetical protein [Solimonas marina]|uniref:Uncharacterized protein n=1 Tax=Solimonas marina TaxID=2714601 RepID=A0A969WAF7_9GAMM|nr:hypothetical protein [Solimonas marina]NKF23642.1 hypothetical protein [Solimonas marina]
MDQAAWMMVGATSIVVGAFLWFMLDQPKAVGVHRYGKTLECRGGSRSVRECVVALDTGKQILAYDNGHFTSAGRRVYIDAQRRPITGTWVYYIKSPSPAAPPPR